MSPTLNLRVKPDWAEIDRVRDRSTEFLKECGLGQDAIHAVAMVTCELTENATKYGLFTKSEDSIEISVAITSTTITVEVKNPVGEEEQEDLRRLDDTIQWIRGYQDPFQAYLERLKEVSAQRLDSQESGLGLVRIAYEGQSILDFYVDENNVLAVSAVYSLSTAPETFN